PRGPGSSPPSRPRWPSSWRASGRARPRTWSPWPPRGRSEPGAEAGRAELMVDALEGLRKALEAEHAAVYAYGVVGARTDGARRREATAAFDAHRARRDRLRELIISRGGTPTEPAAGYDLPFPVRTAEDCVRLAALV